MSPLTRTKGKEKKNISLNIYQISLVKKGGGLWGVGGGGGGGVVP